MARTALIWPLVLAISVSLPDTAWAQDKSGWPLPGGVEEAFAQKDYSRALALVEQTIPDCLAQATDKGDCFQPLFIATTMATVLKQNELAERYGLQAMRLTKDMERPPWNEVATLASLIARLTGNAGRMENAKFSAQYALTIREKLDGPTNPKTLDARQELAVILNALGDHQGAEEQLRAIVEAASAAGDAGLGALQKAEGSLAVTLDALGQSEEAEALVDRTLERARSRFGPQSAELATALGNKAYFQSENSRFVEAAESYRQAIDIGETAGGSDYIGNGPLHSSLALSLLRLDRLTDAETAAQRAIDIFEANGLTRSNEYAGSLNNLAAVFEAQAKFGAAEDRYRSAYALFAEISGEDSYRTLTAMTNIALMKQQQGQTLESEKMLRTVLAKRRTKDRREDVVISLNNLAVNLSEQGRLRDAEQVQREAVDLAIAVHGQVSAETKIALNNLAVILEEMGRRVDAIPLYRRALEISAQIYGEESGDYIDVLHNAALLAMRNGEAKEAEPFFRKELRIAEKIYGPDHPRTAEALASVGAALLELGRLDEAEGLIRREVRIREASYGLGHPETAYGYGRLANLLARQKRYDAAVVELRKAWAIIEKGRTTDHPLYIEAAKGLGETYQLQGTNAKLQRAYFGLAARGALQRIDSYADFGLAAQNEMRGYSPIFRNQVASAWALAQAGGS